MLIFFASDITGTYIVPPPTTTGCRRLQLQLNHRKQKGDKYVYTPPPAVLGRRTEKGIK